MKDGLDASNFSFSFLLCVQLQRFSDDGRLLSPPPAPEKKNKKQKQMGKYGTRRQIGICRVEEENS